MYNMFIEAVSARRFATPRLLCAPASVSTTSTNSSTFHSCSFRFNANRFKH